MTHPNTIHYRKILNQILKEEITPLFLEHSFKKSGRTYYKVEAELVKYVDMEFNRWNTYLNMNFWFNLYLYVGDFRNEKKIDRTLLLTKGTGALKKRLGYLWNEEMHMYEINALTDPDAMGSRMKSDMQCLFSFYEKFNNMDDIIKYFLEENKKLGINYYSHVIAVMLAKAGRKEESKKFLNESMAEEEIKMKAAKFYGIDWDKE